MGASLTLVRPLSRTPHRCGFPGHPSPWPPPPPPAMVAAASPPPAAPRHLSRSTLRPNLPWKGATFPTPPASSRAKALLGRLEMALKARRVDEAWTAFDALHASGGLLLPDQALVGGLITASSYASGSHRLSRAYDLAVALWQKKRPDLLHYEALSRLALALARVQMPEPAATVLRIMMESGKLPPASIWSATVHHLVRSLVGSHLVANVLIELCEFFLRCPVNSTGSKLTKPDTTLFNLVVDSCLRFGSPLKARQLIEAMPMVGVIADANSIITIARVYEMNGNRDDLKRLKLLVDSVSTGLLDRHYQQFYDCLLSLHFKFDDIDAAAGLVLDLYQRSASAAGQIVIGKPCFVQVGSGNLKGGCKMLVEPTLLRHDFLVEPECHSGLIVLSNGRILPSLKAIAKLVNGYARRKKIGGLSRLLVSIHKVVGPPVLASLSTEVIVACVELGWLETAHDILDDMRLAGVTAPEVTYASLLMAYGKQNMLKEAKVLLKQMREGGLLVNLSDEKAISLCLSGKLPMNHIDSKGANSVRSSDFSKFLDKESREDGSGVHLIYEFNSSIFFFCKARMMEDAIKTFRRMQERKVQPTVLTFSHLVNGYSSMGMYREITILWGEFKRMLEVGVLSADRDLFECLLWNFIRGGYFERVMDIVNYMAKNNMHADKWKFKREFLKLHKDLYRNLNTANARTEAQRKRLEHVKAFRRWAGIDHGAPPT